MNCKDFELYGSAYIDDMLSNEEKLEFENHIDECQYCNIKFLNLKIIIESANEIEEVELPINFCSELKTNLEMEKVNVTKKTIFNRKKLLSAIVAGLFIIITSVSLLNNSSIFNNRQNLISEIDRMSENQENITFDIASEESAQSPSNIQEDTAMEPRTMTMDNIDEGQESAVEDSIEEANEKDTYNIMTATKHKDSLESEDFKSQPTESTPNKIFNLFVLLPFTVAVGVLIYKKFKK